MIKRLKNGIDAPLVPLLYILGGIFILISSFFNFKSGDWHNGIICLLIGILLFICTFIFIRTSLFGKAKIWDNIFKQIKVKPDDKVLDIGCGHGLVLMKAASRLNSNGHAWGIDLWKNQDQSSNSLTHTQKIISENKLNQQISLETGNATKLPFSYDEFDLVTASFIFHNIKPESKRKLALDEAFRVLNNNGILAIVDTGNNRKMYIDYLQKLGIKIIYNKNAGYNGWWTGPWMGSYIIIAKKQGV